MNAAPSAPAWTRARETAGFTVAVAAKRARIAPEFLARLEKRGGFSYPLASRLAALYGCSLGVFLNINPTPKTRSEKTPVSDNPNVFGTSRNVPR